MKISEVTIHDLKEYANEESNDSEVDKNFNTILVGVTAYIKGYTGLTTEQIDTKEDLTLALLVIASEMYDNRQFTVENDKVNPIIKSILNMHCVNLL